jgi:hypothetical protein
VSMFCPASTDCSVGVSAASGLFRVCSSTSAFFAVRGHASNQYSWFFFCHAKRVAKKCYRTKHYVLSTHRQKRPYVHVLNLFLAMGLFPAALEKQFGQQYGHQTLTHHFHFICFVPAKNWFRRVSH